MSPSASSLQLPHGRARAVEMAGLSLGMLRKPLSWLDPKLI